jgi:hypothetical protein
MLHTARAVIWKCTATLVHAGYNVHADTMSMRNLPTCKAHITYCHRSVCARSDQGSTSEYTLDDLVQYAAMFPFNCSDDVPLDCIESSAGAYKIPTAHPSLGVS